MAHPSFLKLLTIFICFGLGSTRTFAADERATPDEMARLAAGQKRVQAKAEGKIQGDLDAMFEKDLDAMLTSYTSALLLDRVQSGQRVDGAAPAAMQGTPGSRSTPSNPSASNTTCRMVGRTLECVLREHIER